MSVKIMGMVWDLFIPQNQKLVMLAYADHASHDGTNIYPAVKTIAQKTGYSERSIQMITRELEEQGYLIDDGHGPKGTNKWRIPIYGGQIVRDSRGADFAPVQSEAQRGAEIGDEGCSFEQKGVKHIAPESSLTVNESSLTFKKIIKYFENNIQPITSAMSYKIGDAIDTYPEQWILDAIQEAVVHNARNWAYIDKILKNWQAKGRGDNKPLDKLSPVDRTLLERGIPNASDVIQKMGLNDVTEEQQKQKYLEQKKRKELNGQTRQAVQQG